MAHRRISSAEKGKGIELSSQQPSRLARVKAPLPDNSELLRKHSLTLIGRVTNKSTQKVWSLIPFFTEHWKTEFKPIGADLGNGLFQFQFELESDLLAVLEQRPYHYARWMVILQRWEPTVSPNFPSLIPFWIKVQGLPVHLWTEPIIRVIGEDIGLYEKAEITPLTARMRVHIDGLLPLIKTSVVEFPNGDSVTTTLLYERLDKHCSKCLRLDHELKECLVARAEKKALQAAQEEGSGKDLTHANQNAIPIRGISASSAHQDPNAKGKSHQSAPSYHFSASNNGDENSRLVSKDRRDKPEHRFYKSNPKDWEMRSNQRRFYRNDDHSRSYRNHPPQSYRGNSHQRHPPVPPSRNYYREIPKERSDTGEATSVSPKQINGSTERGIPRARDQAQFSEKLLEEARGEAKQALLQYTKCNDPSEREVRVERAKQAEERGQLEETALRIARRVSRTNLEAQHSESCSPERRSSSKRRGPASQIIAANAEENTEDQTSERRDRLPATLRLGPPINESERHEDQSLQSLGRSADRIPAAQRLGPLASVEAIEDEADLPRLSTVTRKPGRPPGKKTRQEISKGPVAAAPPRRTVARSKPSPIRRKDTSTNAVSSKGKKNGKAKKGETSRVVQRPSDSTASDNAPIINLDVKKESPNALRSPPPQLPPPPGTVVARSDAAWSSVSKKAGLGWIILDEVETQSFQHSASSVLSPLVAEGLALREAVKHCRGEGRSRTAFELDSAQLVKALNSEIPSKELYGIIADVNFFISTFDFVSFNWIPRERNFMADCLAKDALNVSEQEAEYTNVKKFVMAFFFAVTTPFGIALGIALSSVYKDNSLTALITVGLLNACSAGLLIYMALVDLLAAEFMGSMLQGSVKLQLVCFGAALLGCGGMSVLAKWA
ncbi:hypothetical protein Bca4012_060177 [Brassica carinata]